MPNPSHQVLDTGDRLHLVTDDGSDAGRVTVVRVRDGLIWVSGAAAPGEDGARIMLERRISGDAAYRAAARVERIPPESWALRRTGDWERVQRRNDVRVATRGIDLELAWSDISEAFLRSPMSDLSAGGAALKTEDDAVGELAAGKQVHCRFTVPGVGAFAALAQIIRVEPAPGSSNAARVALRFLDLDPDFEGELRRWVLHVQARQAR